MNKILICIMFTLLGTQAFAQNDIDPKAESQKARDDAWAAATKAKAANDAAVAEQRAVEAKKKDSIVHIYGEKKGGATSK